MLITCGFCRPSALRTTLLRFREKSFIYIFTGWVRGIYIRQVTSIPDIRSLEFTTDSTQADCQFCRRRSPLIEYPFVNHETTHSDHHCGQKWAVVQAKSTMSTFGILLQTGQGYDHEVDLTADKFEQALNVMASYIAKRKRQLTMVVVGGVGEHHVAQDPRFNTRYRFLRAKM